MQRAMPPHRRTQVTPAGALDVQGQCLGLSQTSERQPYCTAASPADVALIRLISAIVT